MGRRRVIDRDAVLDAAQRVVIRDGAAKLTLEAVAAEADISKASVLYDYGTKDALIRAIIEKRVATEAARVETITAQFSEGADVAIRGRIAAATRSVSDEDRAVAVSLCAAAAQNATLRGPIQEAYRRWTREIETTSKEPRGALLAFLAIEGLALLEWFGLHSFSLDERERVVREIDWLRSQSPRQDRLRDANSPEPLG